MYLAQTTLAAPTSVWESLVNEEIYLLFLPPAEDSCSQKSYERSWSFYSPPPPFRQQITLVSNQCTVHERFSSSRPEGLHRDLALLQLGAGRFLAGQFLHISITFVIEKGSITGTRPMHCAWRKGERFLSTSSRASFSWTIGMGQFKIQSWELSLENVRLTL